LASEPDIALALTDASLPDGNWSHVLGHAANQSNPVPVLLITPVSTGALWSEALWRGVYDVLVEPFGVNELSRAVEGALRTSGCLTNLPRSFTHHGLTLGNYTPGHP
jgi:DNA-binding NtrC family response regulator